MSHTNVHARQQAGAVYIVSAAAAAASFDQLGDNRSGPHLKNLEDPSSDILQSCLTYPARYSSQKQRRQGKLHYLEINACLLAKLGVDCTLAGSLREGSCRSCLRTRTTMRTILAQDVVTSEMCGGVRQVGVTTLRCM